MLEITLSLLLFFMSLFSWLFLYVAALPTLHYFNPCHGSVVYDQHIRRSVAVSLVSAVQGLLSSGAGISIVLSCRGDVIRATHPLAQWYAWVGMAYFYYDLWAMFQVERARPSAPRNVSRLLNFCRRNPVMVAHHLVVATVLAPLIIYRRGVGDFFVGCFYCLEISALFTNFRSVLSKLGYKSTKLYKMNAGLMVLTFALCRVVVFPFMYWCYGVQHRLRQDLLDLSPEEVLEFPTGASFPSSSEISESFTKAELSFGRTGLDEAWTAIVLAVQTVPLHCTVGCSVVLLPQLYWLTIMSRTAVKMVCGRKGPSELQLIEHQKAI